MNKKITQEEFIKRLREIHGDKYDYSKVEYVNLKTPVCIICPEHGEFWQKPHDILYKHAGCFKCGVESRSKKKTSTTEEFIKKAREIHGDKYDYSKVEYKKAKEKVCIICPEHGEFWQTPNGHLSGKGCRKCKYQENGEKRSCTIEEFIEKARKVHGNKYDYSKVEYKNNKTPVCIICPEHGEFWQKPNTHLNGEGCYKCYYKIYDKSSFILESKKIHGDKYDYSKVEYVNLKTPVCIICPEHGEFWQKPMVHVHQKCGCPICNESRLEEETRLFLKENNIKFNQQKMFNWLGLQRLDFYLPDYNIAIECQGIQHFEPTDFSGKGNKFSYFEYVKKLDNKKKSVCEKNGVKIYYIKYNEDFERSINNILNDIKTKQNGMCL